MSVNKGSGRVMTLTAGTRLGAYEITGSLGVGGMGEVYRAKDTKLGRDVAIKTLPSALAQDHDRLARFEREAKLLAALNHAHIGVIYGLDEHEGTRYISMELVEGETLEAKLKAGSLPVEDALRLAVQIAGALEAAHEKGVIHRDLKPANIMITRDGVAKVLDFGLAKAFTADSDKASAAHSPALSLAMTQAGLILGTAGYMSPEQASGQATDQRADVWAFGVVLYEMLTGLPLFSGESVPHVLAAVLQREPDWNRLPKNLHPRLKLLLERCLEKKARNRYSGIADARVDIEKVLSDPRGVTAVADAPTAVPAPSIAQRVGVPVAFVAAGAAVAAIAALSLRPAPVPAPINRLVYPLPEAHELRNLGRPVMALSPDGRRLVYNTTDGLYVRSLDALEARLIPGTEESLTNPFFSPDGQSLAYFAAGELKRVSLNGGAPVVIAGGVTNLYGAHWASDGTILFGQSDGIYRVPANGGTPSLVIPALEGEVIYGPELLPDGESVLFSATTTPSWDEAHIAVQSLATGERTGLVSGGSEARYTGTGHLVYALRDGLFAVAFDAATLTVSGGAVSLVQGVTRAVPAIATGTANYGIASDGTLVYLSADIAGLAAWTPVWADRDGNEEPLGLGPCRCASPAVSPDGTRLAYDFPTEAQTDSDVWVWSLSQRTNTRLTFEPGFQLGALWSPDSTRIAYSSLGLGLFVRPADGTGTPERLLEAGGAPPPVAWAWTAADELIISQPTASGGVDIALLSLADDRELRPLLTSQFNEYRPALSPDGRWLAYQSDESGQFEIFVRPFPEVGAGRWQVSSGGGEQPRWSRDGHTLVYLGATSLMAASVRQGAAFTHDTPEAVLDRRPYLYNALPPRMYDVSQDGERFLMMKLPGADTQGDALPPQFIVVTNWVEELKQRVPTR
jgi:Tol biopolymer transport system component